ncbi:hypothetical protein MLD38_036522 [Melastoma candidum]|uniref:Uncharacterized protein n=1 Tax=Melastoma candidum TaxID=119954 RepID=A0ACB9LKM9_9MYRT|nr:hypothetical protein MLD38_036522 [Melastoma candidum]
MADPSPEAHPGHAHNPSRTIAKSLLSFLYKAATATLFLVLVPLLTSRPPDFVVLPGRSWEILHIALVGIAVSYGVFGRRKGAAGRAEEEKDGGRPNPNSVPGKFENAQSYVNRFLQLSSLFDDEGDGSGVSPTGSDVGRTQSTAWNIQYIRNEPVLIVDEDRSAGSSARISDKPLLLPIRSLRSRVSDEPRGDSAQRGNPAVSSSRFDSKIPGHHVSDDARDDLDIYSASGPSLSVNGSNAGSILKRDQNGSNARGHLGESGVLPAPLSSAGANTGLISKRAPQGGSNRTRNGRAHDSGYTELETNVKDSVVLPSPIPWRSRSGRMDAREGLDLVEDTIKADDGDWKSQPVRPQFFQSSSTTASRLDLVSTAATPSPKKVSPSTSVSSVLSEAKMVVTPPLPPPPLMTTSFKLPSEKPSSLDPVNVVSTEKDIRNSQLSDYMDDSRKHPKSVRTVRSSRAATQTNTSGKDLGENFFKGILENKKRPQEFFKKMIIKPEDEETQSEDDSDNDSAAADMKYDEDIVSNSGSDGGPDVDKKADEFIAKFREQIRLQRVESMKRAKPGIGNNPAR